jgi:hypothetical protein
MLIDVARGRKDEEATSLFWRNSIRQYNMSLAVVDGTRATSATKLDVGRLTR